jgi:hypothetical protein
MWRANSVAKAGAIDWREVLEEELKDPIFRAEWEAWREESDDDSTLSRIAIEDFAETDRALRSHGLSLDEIIKSGREIRSDLLREMYGIEPSAEEESS